MKAFPSEQWFEKENGMDLRDYFAAKAMQEMVHEYEDYAFMASLAYDMADAMMKVRGDAISRIVSKRVKEILEKMITGCNDVKSEDGIHKDAKDLSTLIIKDCNKAIKILEGIHEIN
jgi:rubrerythrin